MDNYGLGRFPEFDERSRRFASRDMLPPDATLFTKIWDCDVYLDQGSDGACVGFSIAHELAAIPVEVKVSNELAIEIYLEAQKIDEWEGGAYPGAVIFYEGTSVLAGMKIAKAMGYYSEYRWHFGLEDLKLAIPNLGPSIAGINWYEGMFYPDANGYIRPTGRLSGGHAILVRGIDMERGAFLLHNSWGADWGINGTCWISFSDMGRLLNESGDAAIPLVRHDIGEVVDPVEPEIVEPVEPETPAGCLGSIIKKIWRRK
jgi:hypothetical protein